MLRPFEALKKNSQFIENVLIAISHRGLGNGFFNLSFTYFPYSIWTFISLFFLNFYITFLFGLLYPFWTFASHFFLASISFYSIGFSKFLFFLEFCPIFLFIWLQINSEFVAKKINPLRFMRLLLQKWIFWISAINW